MSERERDRLLNEAREANSKGRLEVAVNLCDQALRIEPTFVPAKLLMGIVATRLGRSDVAIRHLREVVQADSSSYDALFGLAVVYRNNGRFVESVQAGKRAVALRPGEAQAHLNLGLAYFNNAQLKEAITCFDEALKLDPKLGAAHHNRGLVLLQMGVREEAVAAFQRSMELSPSSLESLFALGQAHLGGGNSKGAQDCAKRALAINPRMASALVLLSSALADEDRLAEAEEALQRAVAIDPRTHQTHQALSMLYQQMGRFPDARRSLERSLELQPRQGAAYFYKAQLMKVGPEDRELVDQTESLLDQGGLPLAEQALLHFAAGKALDDLNEYERAIRHFEQGTRATYVAHYGNAPLDRERFRGHHDRLTKIMTPGFLKKHQGVGLADERPIFICGMVRSGTTLLEQIVSSHPDVSGAGELEFWVENRWKAVDFKSGTLNEVRLQQLADEYLKLISSIAPGASRVTDKLPGNAGGLGLLHLAFPQARMLHVKRDPRDTCLSILTTWFRRPPEFASSKEDIVFAYEQYLEVVAHWRSVLPRDRFMDIEYEELTAEPERVTRQVIEFCGLEWNDACLAHEKNDRRVKTPSLWQVRNPVNRAAVERWRRYEPWLGPILQLKSSGNQEI